MLWKQPYFVLISMPLFKCKTNQHKNPPVSSLTC